MLKPPGGGGWGGSTPLAVPLSLVASACSAGWYSRDAVSWGQSVRIPAGYQLF